MKNELPRVSFNPLWGRVGLIANPLLKCEYGWSGETTSAYFKHAGLFSNLWLMVRRAQSMTVPDLNGKTDFVKKLHLLAGGPIYGIEQFRDVEEIYISSYPENGVDFSAFPVLAHVSSPWSGELSKSIFECHALHSLYFDEGFPDKDCSRYVCLPKLRRVGFTRGSIKSLNGLDKCSHLESIDLNLVRGFSDLNGIDRLKGLNSVSLQNLPNLEHEFLSDFFENFKSIYFNSIPKVTGMVAPGKSKNIENIQVVNTENITIDFLHISDAMNIEKIFVSCPHINLDLDEVFSLKNLKLFMCRDVDVGDMEIRLRAERHGKKIIAIDRVGPKKARCIQISFEGLHTRFGG